MKESSDQQLFRSQIKIVLLYIPASNEGVASRIGEYLATKRKKVYLIILNGFIDEVNNQWTNCVQGSSSCLSDYSSSLVTVLNYVKMKLLKTTLFFAFCNDRCLSLITIILKSGDYHRKCLSLLKN